jgi:hypothetical protein
MLGRAAFRATIGFARHETTLSPRRMMKLIHVLNELSPWLVVFLVVVAAEIYSIGLMLLCRRRWGTSMLSLNNEVAGFKFAVVGVLYAVLLAFVVIAVWEDYRDTETVVRNEAKAVIDLHELADVLPDPGRTSIRRHLRAYAKEVRESEWPAMARGEGSPAAATDLDHLNRAIFEGSPERLKDLALYQNALRLLTVINDNRTERLDSSDGSVPGVLWLVLLAGGLIVLGYPSFFGTSSLVAQVLMTATLAVLVALTFFVGLVLDYPFTGEVYISPAPFDQALQRMPPPEPTP